MESDGRHTRSARENALSSEVMCVAISPFSSIRHWFGSTDFAAFSPVPASCLRGPCRQGWLGSTGIQFFEDEIECNPFVLFQVFLEQTAQARSDLGMRGGFFSRSHPVCVALLILVHEPQSDVAAIVCCCEVHTQAPRNVQVREPRGELDAVCRIKVVRHRLAKQPARPARRDLTEERRA